MEAIMDLIEQNKFVKDLSPHDAIEIIGLTPEMITAVKDRLAQLNKYEGDCYTEHFKGPTSK